MPAPEELPPLGKFVIQSFDAGDADYPIVVVTRDNRAPGYVIPTDLAACPDPRYPAHRFVDVTPTSVDARVLWVYMLLPGPWIPFTRYDLSLGPIQGRRRKVVNTGQSASQSAITKTTYEAWNESDTVSWQIEETNSDGTGTDGAASNPAFPVRFSSIYDGLRGPVQTMSQLVRATGNEISSETTAANAIFTLNLTAGGTGYTSAPTVTIADSGGGTGSGATAIAYINPAGSVSSIFITNPGSGYTTPLVSFSGGGGAGAAATAVTAPLLAIKVEYQPFEGNRFFLDRVVSRWVLAGPIFYDSVPDPATGVIERTQTRSVPANTPGRVFPMTTQPVLGVTATSTSAGLTGVTVNAPGTGSVPGDVLVPVGGTQTSPAALTVTATQLVTWVISAAGAGFLSTDTIAASGGTGTPAKFRAATLKLVSVSPTNPGINFAVGNTVSLNSGAVVTVSTLQLADLARNAPGSGYAPGDTVTLAGGTSTTRAVVTLDAVELVSYAVDIPPTGVNTGDNITMIGGVAINPAILRVTGTQLNDLRVLNPGTGMDIGTQLSLVGGTFTTAAVVFVTHTQVVSATVAAGGSGGTNGTRTVTGTTGMGTKFQASVTVAGGAITAVLSISVAGDYTANPPSISNEPVTGGGLVGAQLSIVMGALQIGITDVGSYTDNPTGTVTSTGGGNDATFNSLVFEASGYTLIDAGLYTQIPTDFTSTGGSNDGAFNTLSFGAGLISIANGGSYTVGTPIPTQFSTSGSGSGISFQNATYGIGTAAVTTPGVFSVTPSVLAQTSTNGAGSGAVFIPSYGLLTLTLLSGGAYAVNPASLSLTSSGGSGATLGTLVFGVATASVSSAGAFSVASSTFTTTGGSGTGATFKNATYSTATGTPAVITVASTAGYLSGFDVTFSGAASFPSLNGTYPATVLNATQFSVPLTLLAAGSLTGAVVGLSIGIYREVVHSENNAISTQVDTQVDVSSLAAASAESVSYGDYSYDWPPRLIAIDAYKEQSLGTTKNQGEFVHPTTIQSSYTTANGGAPAFRLKQFDGPSNARFTTYYTAGAPGAVALNRIVRATGQVVTKSTSIRHGAGISIQEAADGHTAIGETFTDSFEISYRVDTVPLCLNNGVQITTHGKGDAVFTLQLDSSIPPALSPSSEYDWLAKAVASQGRNGLWKLTLVELQQPSY